MPFTNVFRLMRIGSFAQGVSNLNALLRRERNALFDIPTVCRPKTAAFLYDPLHREE